MIAFWKLVAVQLLEASSSFFVCLFICSCACASAVLTHGNCLGTDLNQNRQFPFLLCN